MADDPVSSLWQLHDCPAVTLGWSGRGRVAIETTSHQDVVDEVPLEHGLTVQLAARGGLAAIPWDLIVSSVPEGVLGAFFAPGVRER